MKNLILFFCLLPIICAAQPGYITTVACNGMTGFAGDGGPATTASMGQALGVCVDGNGNIYIPDDDYGRIRKVNAVTGIITTFAGGGSSTADGIAATTASLSLGAAVGAITTDAYGNVIIIDGQRVRKITVSTGIITTLAGNGIAGFSGDGGPATAAQINYAGNICLDGAGNLYIGDHSNYRVRKVNTAGIISTYAGIGTAGFSGDGGPATAAQFQSPDGLCMDAAGNMYVADRYNYRIRKITPSGIISTYAGMGSGFSGDGGPATAARFSEPSNVCTDNMGNLYIADFHNSRVRKVSPTGIVSTFAGGGSSMGSGVPATSASFSDVWGIGVDGNNNIYIPDRNHSRIRKVNSTGIPTAIADSFSVFTNPACSGPGFTISPAHYSASLSIKTWFGDGTSQTDAFSATSGYAWFNHTYNYPGLYTVKHVLYNGTTPQDSITYNYTYQFCRTLPVRLYSDVNSNCVFDTNSECLINNLTKVEIDSNSTPVDTVMLMSGIDYNANGSPGTVYKFKVLSTVPGLFATCPSTGIITDTLIAGNNVAKYIGFQCSGTPGFDLGETVFIQSGVHMQSGQFVVNNTYCTPQPGVFVVNFSPKYTYQSAYPAPATVVGHTITWNLGPLSSIDATPKNVHYTLTVVGPYLTPGDTANSTDIINPVSGDMIPGNNTCGHTDTVKGSYDPNEMDVSPSGYIPTGTTLTYTTEFENTGNDTAQNIYVLDTLPNTLDVHSLAMVSSSHSVILSKTYNGTNWVLKFNFPNIKLLDSTHHDQCTGLFVFTIKALSALAPGTVIPNRAGIYFDDNSVVMTNSATDIIDTLPAGAPPVVTNSIRNGVNDLGGSGGTLNVQNTATPKEEITLYPNPITNTLHIDKVAAITTYRIINIVGRTIQQGTLQQGSNIVSLQSLVQGMYMVELTGTDGNRTIKKVVKE